MDWPNRRVLVTGGASFIGSHLTDALVEREAKVCILVDVHKHHYPLAKGRAEREDQLHADR